MIPVVGIHASGAARNGELLQETDIRRWHTPTRRHIKKCGWNPEDMLNRLMVVWHTVKTRVCSIQAGRRPFIRRSLISLDAILCLSSLNWTTRHFYSKPIFQTHLKSILL